MIETKYTVETYVVGSIPYIHWYGELAYSGWMSGSGDNPFHYEEISTQESTMLWKLLEAKEIKHKKKFTVIVES